MNHLNIVTSRPGIAGETREAAALGCRGGLVGLERGHSKMFQPSY